MSVFYPTYIKTCLQEWFLIDVVRHCVMHCNRAKNIHVKTLARPNSKASLWLLLCHRIETGSNLHQSGLTVEEVANQHHQCSSRDWLIGHTCSV